MISIMPVVFYVFAFLVVSGGAMGTAMTPHHEPWSIIGSAAFGIVAVIGGVMMKRNPRSGLLVGLIDAIVFVGFFAYKFSQSGKPMPAIPSIGMGAIVIVLAAIALGKLGKAAA